MSYGGVLDGAFFYPAKDHGGFGRNVNSCVPLGARLQLDRRFACGRTRLLVNSWERQACRTMQVYGMIIKDTMCFWPCRGIGYDAVKHLFGQASYRAPCGRWRELPVSVRQRSGYRAMPVEILRHLHVIDWTKWTGARNLRATVERSGAVSLRDAHGRSGVRVTGAAT